MPERNEDLIDELTDLIGRLDQAEANLIDLSEQHKPLSDRRKRLEGKANGVNLARSYVRESLKRASHV